MVGLIFTGVNLFELFTWLVVGPRYGGFNFYVIYSLGLSTWNTVAFTLRFYFIRVNDPRLTSDVLSTHASARVTPT